MLNKHYSIVKLLLLYISFYFELYLTGNACYGNHHLLNISHIVCATDINWTIN